MSEFKKDYKKVPSFRRNALQRKVPLSWRKPKGLFNKRKDGSKSKGKMVKIGYGQNRKYRFLVPSFDIVNNKPSGYQRSVCKVIKRVTNFNELKNIQTAVNQCIILSRTIGKNKKRQMVNYCLANSIRIFPFQLRKLNNEN